jgi:hypothetical protein
VSVGTLAVTLGAVTLAATGTVANQVFTGTLNATLGDVTLAATGKAFAKGTLAATLGDVTLAATGKALASGTLNATLGAVTLAGTGKIPNRGALAVTLGDVTLFARGRSRDSVEPPSSVCLDAWFTGAIQITAFVDDVPLDGLYQLEVTLPWQPISRCTQETANSSRSVSRQQVESPSILAASTSGFSLPGRRTIALR